MSTKVMPVEEVLRILGDVSWNLLQYKMGPEYADAVMEAIAIVKIYEMEHKQKKFT